MQDLDDMLADTKTNVKTDQDHYKHYADEHRRVNMVFQEGKKVFLKVPRHSASLKKGKVSKLSPRYCGLSTILKRVGDSAYKLDLHEHSKVHPIFHVSYLRKRIGKYDSMVDIRVFVDYKEPLSLLHEPECILDVQEKMHSSFCLTIVFGQMEG